MHFLMHFMRGFPIFVMVASLAVFSARALSQARCSALTVPAQAEIATNELTLADLLSPGACPDWYEAAGRLHLGRAPLVGGIRVLEGSAIRALVQRVLGNIAARAATIPERVTVRRGGASASCSQIVQRLAADGILPTGKALGSLLDMECGAIASVPARAPLAVSRTAWDVGTNRWNVSVRCVHAADCVPFLLRVSGEAPRNASVLRGQADSSRRTPEPPVVWPGHQATLSWDQSGIRLAVPVVCLDAGRTGQRIRVRILGKERTIEATVVSSTLLRAIL
jgi:hypothetical protein